MNKTVTIVLISMFFLVASAFAGDDYIDAVKKGNEAFLEKDYKKALEQYHIAETEIPESSELDYNIAGALYEQGNYEETVDKYTRALNTVDIGLETDAHYNLGNTYYRMGDYVNAIKSYENALNNDPTDVDAKYNLELARKMLKEQTKSEEQQQQDQQQQQQQQEEQEKDKQQQDQQEQEQQDQQQQQQENEQQDQQEQQQPQPQDEKEMSKEDAERILNALRDDEQDIQKKIKRQKAAGDYTGKDW